jgi:hypothetical protein
MVALKNNIPKNASLKLERLCYSAGEAYVDCMNKKGTEKTCLADTATKYQTKISQTIVED